MYKLPASIQHPSTFEHKEAYCHMEYLADDGEKIMFWNSRDGVTPFRYTDKNGKTFQHANRHLDRLEQFYLPKEGDMIWISIDETIAELLAKKRLERFKGTEYEIEPGTEQYDTILKRLKEDEFLGCPIAYKVPKHN